MLSTVLCVFLHNSGIAIIPLLGIRALRLSEVSSCLKCFYSKVRNLSQNCLYSEVYSFSPQLIWLPSQGNFGTRWPKASPKLQPKQVQIHQMPLAATELSETPQSIGNLIHRHLQRLSGSRWSFGINEDRKTNQDPFSPPFIISRERKVVIKPWKCKVADNKNQRSSIERLPGPIWGKLAFFEASMMKRNMNERKIWEENMLNIGCGR